MMHARTFLITLLVLAAATIAQAQSAAPLLYRVFLADGTALSSFGEWARVDNRLVFSMPLVAGADGGDLHLVSLPIQRVDLARTERYAEAVRAAQYTATRGEADFAQLSSSVAQTLNQVALIADPRQRLATAERARRALADWPGAHYGYRAAEVREIIGVLDEVISGLRASAGQDAFELSLSTNTMEPPAEPLLPPPDQAEIVQSLMAVSEFVESPAEKVSLLQSVVALIDRAVGFLPESIASAIRARAIGEITEEERIDGLYSELRTAALDEAVRHAQLADVRALEELRVRVRDQDTKLGTRRPGHMSGLLATLEAHLDSARRLRLAQDQWLLGERKMRAYRRAAIPYIEALIGIRRSLDDIKLQAGPAPQKLRPLGQQLDRNARRLALIEPPPQLAAIHAVFRSAYTLAKSAVQLRRDAVEAASIELARQASAAASGALMLLERARADLRAAAVPPIPLRSSRRP